MPSLDARLLALERFGSGDHAKPLPHVVPDSTTDTELAQLRQHGREVYRVADFVELCFVR